MASYCVNILSIIGGYDDTVDDFEVSPCFQLGMGGAGIGMVGVCVCVGGGGLCMTLIK